MTLSKLTKSTQLSRLEMWEIRIYHQLLNKLQEHLDLAQYSLVYITTMCPVGVQIIDSISSIEKLVAKLKKFL